MAIENTATSDHIDRVLDFLAAKSERGEIPKETARQRSTAIKQILSPLEAAEPHEVAWVEENLDAIGSRWATLNPSMKGDTAKAYISRARASIEDYKSWCADKTGWRFKQRESNPRPKRIAAGAPAEPERRPGKLRSFPLASGDELSYAIPDSGLLVDDVRRLVYHLMPLARDWTPPPFGGKQPEDGVAMVRGTDA